VVEAVQKARTPVVASADYPTLKDALPVWIDAQVQAGEIGPSTAKVYRGRCAKWVYPALGDLPVNQVTREQIGGIRIVLTWKATKGSRHSGFEKVRCH